MSTIIANWKMNLNLASGLELASKISDFITKEDIKDEIVICPSFTMLDRISSITKLGRLKLGAQNCASEPVGARTGEVSVGMLKELGCEYLILGHSERRTFYDETSEIIKRKIDLAHGFELKTVICIGETSEDRMNGFTLDVIKEQLLSVMSDDYIGENLLVAYEPLWAIGTGLAPSPQEVNNIGEYCAAILATSFSFENKIKFLYGGSVDSLNIASMLASKYVDGVLVGGASLEFDSFRKILIAANRLCKQY